MFVGDDVRRFVDRTHDYFFSLTLLTANYAEENDRTFNYDLKKIELVRVNEGTVSWLRSMGSLINIDRAPHLPPLHTDLYSCCFHCSFLPVSYSSFKDTCSCSFSLFN